MSTILNSLIIPFLLFASQLWLNARFKRADEKRDAARADTEAKRKAEAEWREQMERRMETQEKVSDAILRIQCSQTRSDVVHKCHRYIDDLGCASTEEKEALHAEHEEYSAICAANGITNNFVDNLVQQVMELPPRNAVDNKNPK